MLYRNSITRKLISDDISYCILVPLGSGLYIVGLVKDGKLTKSTIRRIISEFTKVQKTKKLLKRPLILIPCLNILTWKYKVTSRGPKLSLLQSGIVTILKHIDKTSIHSLKK